MTIFGEVLSILLPGQLPKSFIAEPTGRAFQELPDPLVEQDTELMVKFLLGGDPQKSVARIMDCPGTETDTE